MYPNVDKGEGGHDFIVKFLIDANIPRSTKNAIESIGHDVTDVKDILPPAAPDSEVASLAVRVSRTRREFGGVLLVPEALDSFG